MESLAVEQTGERIEHRTLAPADLGSERSGCCTTTSAASTTVIPGDSVCGHPPWLNSASIPHKTETYHPNVAGYQAYARLVEAVLG